MPSSPLVQVWTLPPAHRNQGGRLTTPRPLLPQGRRASRPTPAPPTPVPTVASVCPLRRRIFATARPASMAPRAGRTSMSAARAPGSATTAAPASTRSAPTAASAAPPTPAPTASCPTCPAAPPPARTGAPAAPRGTPPTSAPACQVLPIGSVQGAGSWAGWVWGRHPSLGGWRAALGVVRGTLWDAGTHPPSAAPGQACCDTLVLLPCRPQGGPEHSARSGLALFSWPPAPRLPGRGHRPPSGPPGGPLSRVPWDHVHVTELSPAAGSTLSRVARGASPGSWRWGGGAGAHTWLPAVGALPPGLSRRPLPGQE